uniref:Uncharacterized protein n=1 Tax=Brassica oleracea TaxID=3712 RepID=A0A3P6FG76_BRAOL|nr:unnamed protein product [Brassica oleracea]
MIHESVESVEMISSYEIRAASIRKKCFRAVLDLQSQGVCDYMHWSLGFLHVLQVIGTESIVEHKGFRTGFVWDCLKIPRSLSHVILGTRGRLRTLNDMRVSWLFQMVFFSQREGCCRRVEGDRLMRVLSMCDYESLQSSRGSENKILQDCYFQRECSVVAVSNRD